jgi:hypothetical protein
MRDNISKNRSFNQKLLGLQNGSDGSDGTSYPVMENCTLPTTQGTGHIAYLHPLLRTEHVVMHTLQQNNTCATLFAGAAAIL